MNLVRWNPFLDVSILQNQMNRLFEDALDGWAESDGVPTTSAWSPAADIYETDNELVVTADLPGVDPNEIDLGVENNVLTIRGERQFERKIENEHFHRVERNYGTFMRSFTLPGTADENKIRATYKDGVLRVTLPKSDQARPKKIQISKAAA